MTGRIDISSRGHRNTASYIITKATQKGAKMYQTQPPSSQHFSPKISRQNRMPSPPSGSLRTLVNWLNNSPTPPSKTTASPGGAKPPISSHQSENDYEPKRTTKALQPYAYAGSSASSSEPPELNHGLELSRLHTHFLGIGSHLDLAQCKVEVHLHMHARQRPVPPAPYSRNERLKRKRETADLDRECDGNGEEAERLAKKVKLSHVGEVQRFPSQAAGESNRSRVRTRGMTSRQQRSERMKQFRGY